MRQTNLDKIKEISILLAYAVKIEPGEFGIVRHPYISFPFYKDMVLDTEEKKQLFLSDLRETILRKRDILGIFVLLNKPWYLTWLKYCREYMTNKDFSYWFGYAWTASEDPNNDVNVELKELIGWFRESRKTTLMERGDYRIYKNIPDIITLYRGVSKGRNKFGLSYTATLNKAEWFANRWNHYDGLITLNVNKVDVLAYLNSRNEDEYVVDTYKYRKQIRQQISSW